MGGLLKRPWIALALLLSGCGAGAKITQMAQGDYRGPQVNVIALSPGSGPLADAVGVELFNNGLTVVEQERIVELVGRAGLTEFQIMTPDSYGTLSAAGIDALLVVKAVMASDGTPESASVRLTSTHTREVVAGLTWQNGWGGQRGSIADRQRRKNLADAATQIASALIARLNR